MYVPEAPYGSDIVNLLVRERKGRDETWITGQHPLEGSMDFGVIRPVFPLASDDLEQISFLTFLIKFAHL